MVEIYVTETTLFHVAARQLGDATQWQRIATLNRISDPLITNLRKLEIPPVRPRLAIDLAR